MRSDGVADRVVEFPKSDIEKQQGSEVVVVVEEGEGDGGRRVVKNAAVVGETTVIDVVVVDCGGGVKEEPQIGRDSTSSSSGGGVEECRVCQEDNEESLISLGCQCRGGLAKAHQTCIIKWFSIRGSNKCEICQQIATNVAPPDPQASVGTAHMNGFVSYARLHIGSHIALLL